MKPNSIAILALFAVFFFSCADNDESFFTPVEPEVYFSITDPEEVCHGNMINIASQEIIFYAQNGYFTPFLEDLGLAGLTCPSCGLEYILEGDERTASIFCPLPSEPDHGCIIDFVISWTPGSQGFESECRSNMRVIASQEVIYFASNDRYTENLEDLGLAGIVCPACGEEYIMQVGGNGDEFFIECGLPSDPNHGNIDNGVASWRTTAE